DLRGSGLSQAMTRPRTEDDLPISLTVGGSVALAIVLTLLPQLGVNLLGAVLIVIFGFFFATVSSRICGQIGSSANPISGMTIAALLGTCLIFVAIGWTGVDHRVQALSIAAVVAVATANAGNTSQDLKTGFLVGSTPRRQQIAILVGALASALAVGWTLTLLTRAHTYPLPETHAAFTPQSLTTPPGGRAPVGGPRVAGRVHHHRHRADGGAGSGRRRGRVPPDLHVFGSVRRRRGALADRAPLPRPAAVDRGGRVGTGGPVLERPDRRGRHLRDRAGGDRRRPRVGGRTRRAGAGVPQ